MRPRRFGRTLEGISIALDGYDWDECTFKSCELILSEGDLSMVNCTGTNCRLTLQGRAEAVGRIIALFTKDHPIRFIEKDR